jgi:hypothetical protein
MPALDDPSRSRRAPLGAAVLAVALALAACGGSDPPPQSGAVSLPATPSARDCGFRGTVPVAQRDRASGGNVEAPPDPGVYRYRVSGKQVVPGAGVRVTDLPSRSDLFVTSSRLHGPLACFRAQRRYAPDIANTSTFVIRGGEVYLVGVLIQALGESQDVRPDPPVLTISDKGSSWSGRFAGRTYGSYSFSGLGKRAVRVGPRRLTAVGIKSVVAYRGAVSGTQRTIAWVSPSRDVVIAESFRSEQEFGLSSLRLRSHSELLSLHPSPLPARG